jgi:hypothetical protein
LGLRWSVPRELVRPDPAGLLSFFTVRTV